MAKIKVVGIFSIFLLFLSACGSGGIMNKQTGGAAIGGITGGMAASLVGDGTGRDVAMVLGTLFGGLIGSSIGATMDEVDQMKMQKIIQYQQVGQAAEWTNFNTNTHWQMEVTQQYPESGYYCREFQTVAIIEGKRETLVGRACRDPNGMWGLQEKS